MLYRLWISSAMTSESFMDSSSVWLIRMLPPLISFCRFSRKASFLRIVVAKRVFQSKRSIMALSVRMKSLVASSLVAVELLVALVSDPPLELGHHVGVLLVLDGTGVVPELVDSVQLVVGDEAEVWVRE